MARPTFYKSYKLPIPRPRAGGVKMVCASEWITYWMRKTGLSDAKTLRALQELGYGATSPVSIANWRRDRAPIPPENIWRLCKVFGFSDEDVIRIGTDAIHAAYPELEGFLRSADDILAELHDRKRTLRRAA